MFKKGDIVRIKENYPSDDTDDYYFRSGDIGSLVYAFIDFNGCFNEIVKEDGFWWCGIKYVELVNRELIKEVTEVTPRKKKRKINFK